MTINHPNELAIKEDHYKLDGNSDIEFYSNEPYIRLLIQCILNNNSSNELSSSLTLINETTEVNDSEILMIKDEVMGYDDFLFENINTTKWIIDGSRASSFVFASGEGAHTGTVTINEIVLVTLDDRSIILRFTVLSPDFNQPEIQELEKNILRSIKFNE